MERDEYQQAWQAQSSQTQVTVDGDLLLKEVRRNQRDFRTTIRRQNVTAVVLGLLLVPFWFYKGATSSLHWTWYVSVPVLIWVVGFTMVVRMRRPHSPSPSGEPLLRCATESLAQVNHQIWLLRNVFWWLLLPFTIPVLAFFASSAWSSAEDWLGALGVATPLFAVHLAVYSFVDYLDQRAVRADLEPRRQELLALLASLEGDGSTPVEVETKSTEIVEGSGVLRRWLVVAVVSFATFLAISLAGGDAVFHDDGSSQSGGTDRPAFLGVTDGSVGRIPSSTCCRSHGPESVRS